MHKTRISLIALLVLAVLATMLTGCGRKGLIKVNSGRIQKDAVLRQTRADTPADRQRTSRKRGTGGHHSDDQ